MHVVKDSVRYFVWVALCLCSSMLASSTANAAEERWEADARIGIDLGVTGGLTLSPREQAGMAAVSLGLELGRQFSRRWSVFLRGETGSVVLSSYGGAYLMAEHTPSRPLSVAAGAGVEGVANLDFRQGPGEGGFNNYLGVAFPLRFSFNFLSKKEWEQRKLGGTWRISATFVGGPVTSGRFRNDGFFRGGLAIGYVSM